MRQECLSGPRSSLYREADAAWQIISDYRFDQAV